MFEGKKVLLIDDDPQLRQLLEITLEIDGFEVVQAGNGQEALEQLGRSAPDLILLDMMMPVMNGLDFLQNLRQKMACGIPVLALTAMEKADSRERIIAAGANDVLFKPIDTQEMLARIGVILNG